MPPESNLPNEPARPPSSPPVKGPSLEDIKCQLEIDKLLLEKQKLQQEISDARRPYLFRNSQLLITVVALLGTVIGIGVGLREHYYEIIVKNADFAKKVADQTQKEAENNLAKASADQAKADSLTKRAQEEEKQARKTEKEATVAKDEAQKAIIRAQTDVLREERAAATAKQDAAVAKREALARELVAASLSRLSDDPELSILLAAQAITTTQFPDKMILPEAESQLHNALLSSRLRVTIRMADRVTSVAWSSSGDQVASAGMDGTIAISEPTTGKQLHLLKGHQGAVRTLAWSPDGKRLVTGGDDQTARIWQINEAKQVRILPTRTGAVRSVAWSPDGEWIAIGSNQVKLWNPENGQIVEVNHRNDEYFAPSISWSPDGKKLAYGSTDRTTYVWSLGEKRVSHKLFGNDWVRAVAWSPDGKRLVTDNFYQATVWNVETERQVFSLPVREYVFSAAWSPDGSTIAVGSDTTSIWDAKTGKNLHTLEGHNDLVTSISWSPDGSRLLTGSEDHSAKIWIAAQHISEVSGFADELSNMKPPDYGLSWSPDATQIATTAGGLKVRQVETGRETFNQSVPIEMHDPPTQRFKFVEWSPGGSTLIVELGQNEDIRVWNVTDGRELLRFQKPDINLSGMAMSPDGKWLYTAHSLGDIAVWDVATGRVNHTINSPKQYFQGIDFSPNGKYFVTVSIDPDPTTQTTNEWSPSKGATIVWDAQTGRQLATLPDSAALTACWNPNNMEIAIPQDRVVKIWDWRAGKLKQTLIGHRRPISSLAWSPDGTQIASASVDMTTRIWDVASGRQVVSLGGHSVSVQRVAWSPDGTRLASVGADGFTQIYATTASELLKIARNRATRALSLAECRTYLHVDSCPVAPSQK